MGVLGLVEAAVLSRIYDMDETIWNAVALLWCCINSRSLQEYLMHAELYSAVSADYQEVPAGLQNHELLWEGMPYTGKVSKKVT